ncbi:lactonase family protein [Segnochrobactrum spirostomi]|uniref:Lactonase family protein n=1 Tax=Segnochrobactrum spirostomi TaxID=2608987 RepID=A0A6A7Y1X2_9HYPH|nr:lactonase family protein [Segnochrobactrum spirostomi]MQT11772.1 lactonase family protein [Segnochrobactrum spirostomi]
MSETFLFVGTLNRSAPYFQAANGIGLAVYRFDEETGDAEQIDVAADVDNPTFLAVDPIRSVIYATSEVFGWKEGVVSAYRFDPATGRLAYLNKQAALGSITAYCSLTADGRHLLVANYAMGGGGPDRSVAVFPIRDDGGLDPCVSAARHEGSGPNAERQERSHAHCAVESPDGRDILAADLGLDRLVSYSLAADGALLPGRESLSLAPGSGPRHLVFHPSGRFVFAINELDSTIVSIARSAETGALRLVATVPAVPEAARGHNHCSELRLSADGRFLYGANRGDDTIVAYAVDPETGALALIGHAPCGGATPRHFTLSPAGRWLLVANQNADAVALLNRDAADGTLSDSGRRIAIGTPMCVQVVRFPSNALSNG